MDRGRSLPWFTSWPMPPRPKPGRARAPGAAELPSSPDLPHYGTRFFGRENELGILGASLSEAERLI